MSREHRILIGPTAVAMHVVALLLGCSAGSNDDAGQGGDHDATPDLASRPDGGDASAASCPNVADLVTGDGLCNAVPFPTTRVPFSAMSGPAPTFTGGTLIDGLYTAIEAEGWDTDSGSGRQMGLVIGDGGTTLLWFGQTLRDDGSGDVDAGTSGLYWLRANYELSAASSNTLALRETCLAGTTAGPPELLYTVTNTDPPQLLLANATAPNPTVAITTYEWRGCPTVP